MQKGFTFDANRCTGCEACQLACAIENRLDPGMDWRRVYTFNPRRHPTALHLHNSLACNHCLDPSCMVHCPALAYSKEPATGAVTIDEGKCIGCNYCAWACPYDAPQFNRQSGLMEKCTFCSHRLAEGRQPACVSLCPTAALGFGDHEASNGGPRIPGFTPTEIGPAIRFTSLRAAQPPSLHVPFDPTRERSEMAGHAEPKIGLRTEWTLLGFTFISALLVAWVATAAITGSRLRPGIVLPAGLAAMALSTLHLGSKMRAWRAVLNVRRSWLSREVVLFPAFLAASAAAGFSGGGAGELAWAAAVVGFAALFAMDRVYAVTRTPGLATHSAQVSLTGLLFVGLWAPHAALTIAVIAVKLVLYVLRKVRFVRRGQPTRPVWGAVRILFAMTAGILPWTEASSALYSAVLVAVTVGELIDRSEYYVELDPSTPLKQMAADLRSVAGVNSPS